MSDKLVDYIKRGMEKGFNTDYIKKTLLKHGYSAAEVEFAIAKAGGHSQHHVHHADKRLVKIAGVVVGLLLLLLIIGFVQSRVQTESLKEQVVEKEKTAQDYLDQVADLSLEIDTKEKTIDRQLAELKQRDMAIQDKERLLVEMEYVYAQMKEERRQVRDLLMELLQEVIARYKPDEGLNVTMSD